MCEQIHLSTPEGVKKFDKEEHEKGRIKKSQKNFLKKQAAN